MQMFSTWLASMLQRRTSFAALLWVTLILYQPAKSALDYFWWKSVTISSMEQQEPRPHTSDIYVWHVVGNMVTHCAFCRCNWDTFIVHAVDEHGNQNQFISAFLFRSFFQFTSFHVASCSLSSLTTPSNTHPVPLSQQAYCNKSNKN